MRLRLVALGILVAVAAMAVALLWRSEESLVRARLSAAVEALSVPAGERDLNRLARLAGFAKGLAPDVMVEAEPGGPSIQGRDAVVAVASQFAAAGSQQVTVSDVTVGLDDSRTRATATAMVHVTSTTPGQASARDGDVVRIELVKSGGQWLIARAAPESALTR